MAKDQSLASNPITMGTIPTHQKYKPWRIKTAIAFTDRQKALDFEKHLKNLPGGRLQKKVRIFSFEIDKLQPEFFVKIQT
jgi:hypothetical protein